MNPGGPIILIDDDDDDRSLLREVFEDLQLGNELAVFSSGQAALQYLTQPEVRPFIVISDINMPQMSGFELREEILKDRDLAIKCYPFIFFTTGVSSEGLNYGYDQCVQGVFQKPSKFLEWKSTIKRIVDYWTIGISTSGGRI